MNSIPVQEQVADGTRPPLGKRKRDGAAGALSEKEISAHENSQCRPRDPSAGNFRHRSTSLASTTSGSHFTNLDLSLPHGPRGDRGHTDRGMTHILVIDLKDWHGKIESESRVVDSKTAMTRAALRPGRSTRMPSRFYQLLRAYLSEHIKRTGHSKPAWRCTSCVRAWCCSRQRARYQRNCSNGARGRLLHRSIPAHHSAARRARSALPSCPPLFRRHPSHVE